MLKVFHVNSIMLKEKYSVHRNSNKICKRLIIACQFACLTGTFLPRIALNQSIKVSSTSSNFAIHRRFLFGSNVDVSKALKLRVLSLIMSDKVELAMPNSFAILLFAPC